MNLRTYISLVFLLSVYQLDFHTKKDNEWKLVKNKDGIKAYTRYVEGSDIKKVKCVTNVKTKLSSLVSLLKDVSHQNKWMYNCINTKILRTVNDTEYYFYTLSNAPWPVNRRDIVTHTTIKQENNTKKVIFFAEGLPKYLKENKGIVRIKTLKSKWEFTPQKNGTVNVIFYLQIDVGGSVPTWAMNIAIAEGPFQTVKNLVTEVKKDKYKNAHISFIKEL